MVDATSLIEEIIGQSGRWQVLLVALLYISRFSVAYHQLMMVAQHYIPPYKCIAPENANACDSTCESYEFEKTYYEETVATQWNLICDDAWMTSFVQCMVMLGILLGNVGLGWVSDRYTLFPRFGQISKVCFMSRFGRKNILIIEIFVQVVAGTIAAFMKVLPAFIFLRFVSAFATGGMMLTGFVLLMEFIAKKYRSIIGIAFHFPFQLGHASIGLIAYLMPRWDRIQLFCSAVSVVLFCYIWLLPESVRWLMTRDRGEEVVKVLEKAAKCNGRPTENINAEVVAFMKEHAQDDVKGGRCADLVGSRRMATKIIVLSINWFVISQVFYGVAELMGKLAGNPFINIGLAGCVQLPGTCLCIIICKVLGNKYALLTAYTINFVPMFVMMVLPTEPHWPCILCGCISMMGCSMCFSIIYLYTVELIPTVIRNLGMGVTSMVARVGSMLAPYVMFAKNFNVIIPNICFGVQPVVAALLTFFFLPQTKNIDMPDTVEQADQI